MSDKLSVTVLPDGPLKVSHAASVTYCGERVDAGDDVYICRCGESANAPFCDGSHAKVGFSGASTPRNAKPVNVWEGNTIRTRFDPNVCMHVFKCKPLKELRERELAGDSEAAAEIARVVESCPSGALTWEAKGAVDAPAPTAPAADVEIMEGGEVRLTRAYEINADRQDGQPDDRATLCRCGLSKNKPWCDGRHKARKGFR